MESQATNNQAPEENKKSKKFTLKKHHNVPKNAKFAKATKAERLYGLEPIWLVIVKIGATGLLMSFFGGLFTFADQLMLVNFMPNTHNFSFNSLFFLGGMNGNGVFNPMLQAIGVNGGEPILQHIISQTGTDKGALLNFVNAIGNTMGLTVFDSAGVVRSAVSLTAALSIVVNAIPSLFAVGTSVKYTQALGKGDYRQATFIWQNAFVGCITTGLICFCLLIILIPTVIPAQAVSDHLSEEDIYGLFAVTEQNAILHHWNLAYIFSANNGHYTETIYYNFKDGMYHYYAQVQDGKFLDLTQYQLMDAMISSKDLISMNANHLSKFTLNIIDSNGSILTTWNNYYAIVRTYSVKWAEDFMFIMDAGCTLFALGTTLSVIVRSDGAIVMSMIIYVSTVIFNIILDYVFIKVAQIGMEGAATASVIGWIIQNIWYGLYIQFDTKLRSCANFLYLNKKYMYLTWKTMGELILFGLSMLIGTVTFSVFNIILMNQVSYVTVQIIPQVGGEYYLSVLGAVSPIISLFFFTIFGLVRGVDPIFSYNYSAHKNNRVKQAYWWSMSYIIVLGLIVFGLIGFCAPIRDGLLSWFQINADSPDYQLQSASKLIWIWLMQIPIMGLATGGMFVFRSTNRLGTAYVVALLRSCIYNIPLIFIFMAIAINNKDALNAGLTQQEIDLPQTNNAMWFFFYSVPVGAACYSLTIFIMTTTFIYKYLDLPQPRRYSEIWPLNAIIKHHYKGIFNEVPKEGLVE